MTNANADDAGLSLALTSLAYQIDSWASTGLLGTGVLAHTLQTDTGRHIASPADLDTDPIVIEYGGSELHFQPDADGTVRLTGGGSPQTLRLGTDGTWLTPGGEPLSADWLRGLLGTQSGGEREGQL